MKIRLLILALCLVPLFACDKTPKPRNAAERDMFVQADKGFNALMLPLDKYFDRNGTPEEIRDFKKLKENYNADIKNALLQTDPAARDAALRAADDKYMPYINELRGMLRQRAVAKRTASGFRPDSAPAEKDRPRRPLKPVALIIGNNISYGAEIPAPETLDEILNGSKRFLSGAADGYDPAVNAEQYIKADYDYSLKRFGGMFDRLKAAAPSLDGVLTPLQNSVTAKLTRIKEDALQPAPAAAKYRNDRNELFAGVRAEIESVIDGQRGLKKKDFLDKAAAELDARVSPLVSKMKKDFHSDALTAKFIASVNVIKEKMKADLSDESDAAKQKQIKDDAYAKAADCKESAYVEGNAPGYIQQVNENYFNKKISELEYLKRPAEKAQMESLKASYAADIQKIADEAVALPLGTDKMDYFMKKAGQTGVTYSQQMNAIMSSAAAG